MNWQTELQTNLFSKFLLRRALQGAGIAFVLISIFLLGAATGNMHAGSWILVPLTVVPVGGAFGGAFYSIMDLLRHQGGWKKVLANISSVLVYFISLYLSLILALYAVGLWH